MCRLGRVADGIGLSSDSGCWLDEPSGDCTCRNRGRLGIYLGSGSHTGR